MPRKPGFISSAPHKATCLQVTIAQLQAHGLALIALPTETCA